VGVLRIWRLKALLIDMKYYVSIMFVLFSLSAKADGLCTGIGFCGFHPNLPITGSGPLTNLGQGNEALTNAAAHVGWALAIPLLGEHFAGTKGKWVAGVSWIAFTLAWEGLIHSPANPSNGYPSEVRTDLITRIVPTVFVLTF
jgi:hypothetical protein